MNSVSFLTVVVVVIHLSLGYEEHWRKHIDEHNLTFASDGDNDFRKELFKNTHDMIEAHNNQTDKTGYSPLVHNKFSTMTDEEKKDYLGYKPAPEVVNQFINATGEQRTLSLP